MNKNLKIKRQILKAGMMNQLQAINVSLDSANPILTDVEKLQLAVAFANFATLVQKLT